jgi:hypothetical protein
MSTALSIIIAVLAVAFFVWFFIPTKSTAPPSDASGTTLIDPDDSYQIGMLVGMTGGSIPDAAVMRYALDCFKQIHGRPAAPPPRRTSASCSASLTPKTAAGSPDGMD